MRLQTVPSLNSVASPQFKSLFCELDRYRSLARTLALFGVCVMATLCAGSVNGQSQKTDSSVSSFQLYYGGEHNHLLSLRTEIKPSQVVVVDIRGITAYQFGQIKRRANDVGAKLIGYISIGELHSRELGLLQTFAKNENPEADFGELKREILLSENTSFSSYHVDVTHALWRKFIFDKATNMLASGLDGLFLDTVDTVDVYARRKEWNIDRRAESVTGMITLIRDFKKLDGADIIMQNRGLNLIGEKVFVGDAKGKLIPGLSLAKPHEHNPDIILYENAFSSDDEWTLGIDKKLDAIQKSGEVTVVALGYKAEIKDQEKFLEKCKAYRFVPSWATDSQSLHLEITK